MTRRTRDRLDLDWPGGGGENGVFRTASLTLGGRPWPPAPELPDAHGRFGPFGGRYVPETLTRALERTGRPIRRGRRRAGFTRSRGAYGTTSAAVAAVSCPAAQPPVRRGPNLPQTRRPQPHRRAQDQQYARPDPADRADGQAARDRRDRRRPARRGHRDRLRPLRPGVHGLHGRGGHPPAAAQRLQHEAARRRGAAGDQRLADASATRSTRPSATG